MPIDPWIARGAPPVDITNTLAQIAMLRQRDQAIAADENSNKLYERRLDAADRVAGDERKSKEEQKQAEHLLAKTQWALRSPNPRLAILGDPNIDPKAHDAFFQMTDEQATAALKQAEATYAAQLGKGPPEAPPEIKLQDLGGGVRAVTQGGEIKGSPQWPDAPERYAPKGYTTETIMEGGKPVVYAVSQDNPNKRVRVGDAPPKASENKPTLINTPFGETYRYDETTGTRVLVPTEGEEPAGGKPAPVRGSQKPTEKAADTQGRPMVWSKENKRWEYP